MRVAIFGLGYVGCVSAACLAEAGHQVIGVDVNPLKVEMINRGQSPIIEKDMDRLITEGVESSRLRATADTREAVGRSDLSFICVGTPSDENGGLNLRYIRKVARDIGQALKSHDGYHVVAVRSTVLPGTLETEVIPLLEGASGKKAGQDFGVCANPEFLREGSAVHDFYNPPFTLVGQWDERSGETVAALYQHIDAPVERTDIRTAEMVKYVSNAFHALKITFANETGNIAHRLGVDSHEVMRIFCMDTKLNISTAYLKPGYAFGGSCLPKDLRALLHRARHEDLEVPVLQAILYSNELQARRGVEMVVRTGKKRIGILGLSFKAGTDDLRESPMVYLVETLLGKGYDIKIYDENVSLARLMGANKEYIERVIPHISSLMSTSLEEVVEHAEVLVISNRGKTFSEVIARSFNGHHIIDLVRIAPDLESAGEGYQGISW
jgi:GDP-mannose 6-dehydrogenase